MLGARKKNPASSGLFVEWRLQSTAAALQITCRSGTALQQLRRQLPQGIAVAVYR
jgi:hypothetical protein